MTRKDIKGYLQSIIAIPMLAIVMPLSGVSTTITSLAANNNLTEENSVIITQEEVARKEKADAIDSYFHKYDAPLEGYGMKFVLEAEKNDIDWRLLPAIAMRESTGGKQACKKVPNSVFGYGSCKISFNSIDESIEIVARSLGGNNPKTAHHYDDKTTIEILNKYNSVIPGYDKQVVKIMKTIHDDGIEIK
ncbi:MAG TPA: hypothetical protein VK153_03855 [Candidatus Paceibacterota bacterium]|nr:hypothetical protein [Candidatus Paceibacterota bacterium]